jgi:DNA-binding NarL/FixJ family response regulator
MVKAIESVVAGYKVMDEKAQAKFIGIVPIGSAPIKDYRLTGKEKETIRLATEGLTIGEIGERMCLSYDTVHSHLEHIHMKLHVHSRIELVAKAIREHLV